MRRALLLVGLLLVPGAHALPRGGTPVALVTAETENALIAVGLPSGRILRRLHVPADPQNVEAESGVAVVVSPRAGAVTLVDAQKLRVRKILRGFGSPHIVAFDPGGEYAYVTDDARGQLAVIELANQRVVRRIFVGAGAHHMSFSPDERRLWIALGERARTIVVVDTTHPTRPRVVGRVDPDGAAHDLAFSPDGRSVWVTYDDRSTITVFDAATRRPRAIIAAGAPPQHVAFGQGRFARYAYVTSGNDATLRIVSRRSGRAVRTIRTGKGSFNLSLGGGLVLTSSLTQGTLTELDASTGRRLLTTRVAPATRDVALAVLP